MLCRRAATTSCCAFYSRSFIGGRHTKQSMFECLQYTHPPSLGAPSYKCLGVFPTVFYFNVLEKLKQNTCPAAEPVPHIYLVRQPCPGIKMYRFTLVPLKSRLPPSARTLVKLASEISAAGSLLRRSSSACPS